jgi:hypothetical protein
MNPSVKLYLKKTQENSKGKKPGSLTRYRRYTPLVVAHLMHMFLFFFSLDRTTHEDCFLSPLDKDVYLPPPSSLVSIPCCKSHKMLDGRWSGKMCRTQCKSCNDTPSIAFLVNPLSTILKSVVTGISTKVSKDVTQSRGRQKNTHSLV